MKRPDCGLLEKFIKGLDSIPHGLCEALDFLTASAMWYHKDNSFFQKFSFLFLPWKAVA